MVKEGLEENCSVKLTEHWLCGRFCTAVISADPVSLLPVLQMRQVMHRDIT